MGPQLILVVDDDRDTRELYRVVFDIVGYMVAEASSVSDGFQIADLSPAKAPDPHKLWQEFIEAGTQEGAYDVRRRDGGVVPTRYFAIANVTPGLHVSALGATPPLAHVPFG